MRPLQSFSMSNASGTAKKIFFFFTQLNDMSAMAGNSYTVKTQIQEFSVETTNFPTGGKRKQL